VPNLVDEIVVVVRLQLTEGWTEPLVVRIAHRTDQRSVRFTPDGAFAGMLGA
jgi:hypothetical protein